MNFVLKTRLGMHFRLVLRDIGELPIDGLTGGVSAVSQIVW